MKQVFFLVVLISVTEFAFGHEIRPAYLEIRENTDHSLSITWKQPVMGDYSIPLRPSISTGWLIDSLAERAFTETYLIKRWHITPNHASLDSQVINIAGLERTMTDALIQVTLADNTSFTYLLKPARPFIQLSIAKPQLPPVWEYIQLGIIHIWTGLDHLLFVLGLLLLVKKRSRLFWTITAFTIAHSITLALATLHIVAVSPAFTEPAIALSIAFLAVELVHHYNGKDGLTYRYPWLVAFLFGLLHGLGFASALADVGLPQNNISMALFLFNIGVETGQLFFVFAILLVMYCFRKVRFLAAPWAYKFPAYFIGVLAVYWFIERIIGII